MSIESDLAAAVTEMTTRFGTFITQWQNWATGAVNGGPNSDGMFPITDSAGYTVLVPCWALMQQVGVATPDQRAALMNNMLTDGLFNDFTRT